MMMMTCSHCDSSRLSRDSVVSVVETVACGPRDRKFDAQVCCTAKDCSTLWVIDGNTAG